MIQENLTIAVSSAWPHSDVQQTAVIWYELRFLKMFETNHAFMTFLCTLLLIVYIFYKTKNIIRAQKILLCIIHEGKVEASSL